MRKMHWNFKVAGWLMRKIMSAPGLIFSAGAAPNVSVRTLGPHHVITACSLPLQNTHALFWDLLHSKQFGGKETMAIYYADSSTWGHLKNK